MKTVNKKVFVASLLVLMSMGSMAQSYLQDPKYGADEESRKQCAIQSSLYSEFYKQKNYKDAYVPWNKVLNICPKVSINTYIRGVKILKYKIASENDPNQKQAYIDSLMSLFDKRIENFDQKGVVLGYKAQELFSIAPERYEQAFNIIQDAVNITKGNSDDAALYTYMAVTNAMYDNKKIDAEKVIEIYSSISDYIDMLIAQKPNDDKVKQAKDAIDGLFAQMGVANCDNIKTLFGPRFAANPDDLGLCKKIKSLMSANRCTEDKLYLDALLNIFNHEKSTELALEIAHIYATSNRAAQAEEYYNEAINMETDATNRAQMFLELASITFSELKNPTKAKKLALKALEENPKLGPAYELLGNMYASERNCGSNDFENKTVYWAAVDMFYKAKQADPELEEKMNTLIDSYSQYFPTKEDIFFHDLKEGDTYTVGCWINERTSVRTRK